MSDYFQSPTYGKMSFNQVVDNLVDFILKDPKEIYKLVVGTDSEGKEYPEFVTAIVIHRQGKGGRFFYQKSKTGKKYTLRTRIYEETMKSLILATKLREALEKKFQKKQPNNFKDLEIHTDIGQVGETKEMIKEIVGMVKGNGFEVKIKPESFGATSVADHCLR
ncbi:MAG TPA: ribonuclease H-like YkuK family protein [Candidatus Pacearchaeota archaeon]|nr:ribonuclease H-like YkuK family protein [Candidatus Pacearchaeota archaeon]HOK94100.1 ribonuclease H-like YkuK family protein [Candidatus Pacearchaeota archaeon]HPO75228.1 ribonuclease H-like YkuK family protein [Candidatus Pacearchaeota archaeon]